MFVEHRAIVAGSGTGDGVVGRWSSVVLVSADPVLTPTLDPATAPTLDDLLAADGPLAAVVDVAGEIIAVVRGSAEFVLDGTASTATTPHPVVDADTITLTLDARHQPAMAASLDLQAGTVPGVAITLARGMPATAPSYEVVDLRAGDATTRSPLPHRESTATGPQPPQRPEKVGTDAGPDPGQTPDADNAPHGEADADYVLGIRCSRGHFNNPLTSYCQACGISMVHLTHQLVPGPRPTLGFVVFNDGATYALDRSYLLGRSPAVTIDDGVVSSLVVTDADGSVSSRHARIDLVDWDVALRDLGSTNGTYVWNAAGHRWDRVGDQPVNLSPGAIVALGRKTFVFESAVRRR